MEGRKDEAHMSPDWVVARELIDGVEVREVRHVVTANGVTTELFRPEWGLLPDGIRHAIHVSLLPGAISAWHLHQLKTDHVFCVGGHLRVVLHDPREDSPTFGRVDVLHANPARPGVVVIPPRVWHGIQVLGPEPGLFVNYFDRAYDYADPDDWRLPVDTDEIPYVWQR